MDATRFLDSLKRARLDLLTARHLEPRFPSDTAPRNIESAFATLSTLIETVEAERFTARWGATPEVVRIDHVRAKS